MSRRCPVHCMPSWSVLVLSQQKTAIRYSKYHFFVLSRKKQPCALGQPLWHPYDTLATFQFSASDGLPRIPAIFPGIFHLFSSYFPPCVCSVRNVHSGCCGTVWSCSPGPRSSSPEALLLGSSSPSAAFIFQRFQAPWNPMKCHENHVSIVWCAATAV